MKTKLIELKNICKSYDGDQILSNIDLYINDHEFITFLGPSGCGKTTTLRIIGGFETPDEGDVYFDGKRINDVPAHKRNVNTVFQKYALFPHLNVYDNIAFGLTIAKVDKNEIRQRVTEMLELVNLRGFEKRNVNNLSGGQQQRVAIARTLAPSPKVLFMDEPLSNLDAKLRQEMRTELKRLHSDTNSTFVYVTHDQLEAMTLSTQVCLMNNGLLQQYAPPLEIYGGPANLFVAEFVGNPTMNFIPADVKKLDGNKVELGVLGKTALFQAHEAVKNLSEKALLGVRPEFLPIKEGGAVQGQVYSTLPTGMETTVKVTCGNAMLTSVVFGNVDYPVDAPINLTVNGDQLMLFDAKSGNAVGQGSLTFLD